MLVIKAATLIDGTGKPPQKDVLVFIEGETILQVVKDEVLSIPPDAQVVDASDKVVMPGMIDAHVHVQSGGRNDRQSSPLLAEVIELIETTTLKSYVHAKQDLWAGFTTLRDMGARGYVAIALREAIDQGLVQGPRMRASGQGLSITGGHMDQIRWRPGVTVPDCAGVADSPWAFRQATRHQLKMGADCIKINISDRPHWSGPKPSAPYLQEMTFEEMEAVCCEAHKANVKVAAHSSGGKGITDAILAGVDSLEHAHWLTEEQCDLMAERGTFYVPTFLVVAKQIEMGRAALHTLDEAWEWLNAAMDAKWLSLEIARKAGVKIVTGTDAGFGVCHGENAAELGFLVKAGLSPMEAILSTTKMGADLLDMADKVGTIEPGKLADLLLVDGNPLEEISVLENRNRIKSVIKGGRIVIQRD